MQIHLKNFVVVALLLTLFSFFIISVKAEEGASGSRAEMKEAQTREEIQDERESALKRRIEINNEDRIPASLKAILRRVEAR